MSASNSSFVWATRCLPAWSVLACFVVMFFSFVMAPYGKGEPGRHSGDSTYAQLFLSAYCLILHFQSVSFPIRVTYAIGDLTKRMRAAAATKEPIRRQTQMVQFEGQKEPVEFPVPIFVIIIPAYKEEMETLEETLRVLASHPQARGCYHIYLAMEEKEEKAAYKANDLIATFDRSFYRMDYTLHPCGIPGEAQGKSSNEAWAAKRAFSDYPAEVKPNVLITVMDADTHLSSRYFAQIARAHLDNLEQNQTTIYVPPIVFDRNLHKILLPVRTADLMWAGAGISSLYTGSTVCIPTSVYSLPMTLVERVGGWDTDPGSIGEDMHMYIKCFFALSGNLNVEIVYAAASQCDVSSDVKGLYGYYDALQARYKQALRHMWGSMDTGYAFRQFLEMVDRHRKAGQHSTDLSPTTPNSTWTPFYTSNALYDTPSPTTPRPDPYPFQTKSINKTNCFTLAVRLWEAHFLPIHIAVILAISGIYGAFYPNFLMPTALRMSLEIAGWCRLAGWMIMQVYFYRYEQYHRLCVTLRQDEMRRAGMYEDIAENDGFCTKVYQYYSWIESALFPLGGFVFGSIPALQAVVSHVFTDRLTYVVSLKPQLLKKMTGTMTP